jgi:hypothetical protein
MTGSQQKDFLAQLPEAQREDIIAQLPEGQREIVMAHFSESQKANVAKMTGSQQENFFARLMEDKQKADRASQSKATPMYNRTGQGDLNNILWRLFAWKDMVQEVIQKNIFFGCDFGRPFRSKSIEVLAWADGGWVGWIEPHNSYVHIFYRAGIIGLLFILFIWYLFVKLSVDFIKNKDLGGTFLCTALFYWLIIANFEVILELPYFAIPFWSLFGITFAYAYKKKL